MYLYRNSCGTKVCLNDMVAYGSFRKSMLQCSCRGYELSGMASELTLRDFRA